MDFIWYYPKTNGASLCLESFNEADYFSLWSSMNRFIFVFLSLKYA